MNEPDKRDISAKIADAKSAIKSSALELQAQRQGFQAGMSLLPDRIEEIETATSALAYPMSGTTYTAMPSLQSVTPSTWTTVQTLTLAPPAGKVTADLFLSSTALIRYGGSLSANSVLSRVRVNGQTFPTAPVVYTGFSMACGTYSGVISISVDVYITDPGGVTNDSTAGRENSIRTFTMAVWR